MKPDTIRRLSNLKYDLEVVRDKVTTLESDVDVEALDHDGDAGYPFEDASNALNDLVIDLKSAMDSIADVINQVSF